MKIFAKNTINEETERLNGPHENTDIFKLNVFEEDATEVISLDEDLSEQVTENMNRSSEDVAGELVSDGCPLDEMTNDKNDFMETSEIASFSDGGHLNEVTLGIEESNIAPVEELTNTEAPTHTDDYDNDNIFNPTTNLVVYHDDHQVDDISEGVEEAMMPQEEPTVTTVDDTAELIDNTEEEIVQVEESTVIKAETIEDDVEDPIASFKEDVASLGHYTTPEAVTPTIDGKDILMMDLSIDDDHQNGVIENVEETMIPQEKLFATIQDVMDMNNVLEKIENTCDEITSKEEIASTVAIVANYVIESNEKNTLAQDNDDEFTIEDESHEMNRVPNSTKEDNSTMTKSFVSAYFLDDGDINQSALGDTTDDVPEYSKYIADPSDFDTDDEMKEEADPRHSEEPKCTFHSEVLQDNDIATCMNSFDSISDDDKAATFAEKASGEDDFDAGNASFDDNFDYNESTFITDYDEAPEEVDHTTLIQEDFALQNENSPFDHTEVVDAIETVEGDLIQADAKGDALDDASNPDLIQIDDHNEVHKETTTGVDHDRNPIEDEYMNNSIQRDDEEVRDHDDGDDELLSFPRPWSASPMLRNTISHYDASSRFSLSNNRRGNLELQRQKNNYSRLSLGRALDESSRKISLSQAEELYNRLMAHRKRIDEKLKMLRKDREDEEMKNVRPSCNRTLSAKDASELYDRLYRADTISRSYAKATILPYGSMSDME